MSDQSGSRRSSSNSAKTTNSLSTVNKRASEVNIVFDRWVEAPDHLKQVGRCDDGSYEIEKIERMRHNKDGSTDYLVKWEGWNEEYNSWVPAEDIFETTLIEEFVKHLVSRREIRESIIPQMVKEQVGMIQIGGETGNPDEEMAVKIKIEYNEDYDKEYKTREDKAKKDRAKDQGEEKNDQKVYVKKEKKSDAKASKPKMKQEPIENKHDHKVKKEPVENKHLAREVKKEPVENKHLARKVKNKNECEPALFVVTKPSEELMRILAKYNMLPPVVPKME